jgi:1-acyl-sn-glycerol-3-phosphate acyltransferase
VITPENIPSRGPCLLTFNHYYRPGFNAWWMALALAAVVPEEIHFVMTGELTWEGRRFALLGSAGSRWLLRRLADMYGFTRMPPMPPRRKDVALRARSVRQALRYAEEHPQAVIGLSPEGGDQPGGILTRPAEGAGRFLSHLAARGFPITPAGIFEQSGELVIQFGPQYHLAGAAGLRAEEVDRQAAQAVMAAIAACLPGQLRGEFG